MAAKTDPTSNLFVVVREEDEAEAPFRVGALGSGFALFTSHGEPASLAAAGAEDPAASLTRLHEGGESLTEIEPKGLDLPGSARLFYARHGAVLVGEAGSNLIVPSDPFASPEAVGEAVASGRFTLLGGIEATRTSKYPPPPPPPADSRPLDSRFETLPGPRYPLPNPPPLRRCPAGHWMTVPPKTCPIHGREAEEP